MPRENKTRFAVLAMLSLGPRSGYDIQRQIRRTLGHFWSESHGQIYPTLRKLRSEGLATARTLPKKGKPDRNVFSITPDGREALRNWLGRPPEPPPVRNEMLLKTFVGWHVPPSVLVQHVEQLKTYYTDLEGQYQKFARFLKTRVAENVDATYWLLTLRSGQLYIEARLRWCDEAVTTLRRVERDQARAPKCRQTARSARMNKLIAEAKAALPKPMNRVQDGVKKNV